MPAGWSGDGGAGQTPDDHQHETDCQQKSAHERVAAAGTPLGLLVLPPLGPCRLSQPIVQIRHPCPPFLPRRRRT